MRRSKALVCRSVVVIFVAGDDDRILIFVGSQRFELDIPL